MQCGQGYLLREANVAQRGGWLGDGRGGAEEQSHRADRIAAGKFRALRDGARVVSEGYDWRCRDGRTDPRPQRSHRRLAVSAASRSISADPRLGYLAE